MTLKGAATRGQIWVSLATKQIDTAHSMRVGGELKLPGQDTAQIINVSERHVGPLSEK